MKVLLAAVSLVLFPVILFCQASSQPVISNQPLTADQIAIYRTFLFSYARDWHTPVNLADLTAEFQSDDSDLHSCLRGFALPSKPTKVHRFSSEFVDLKKIRMIDPVTHKISDPGIAIRRGESVDQAVSAGFQAGVLTLSEIVFDPTHHFAAFSYSFHCGMLCGNGATVIFELKNGAWKSSKRQCVSWIS